MCILFTSNKSFIFSLYIYQINKYRAIFSNQLRAMYGSETWALREATQLFTSNDTDENVERDDGNDED